jgi:acetyltransferase-like isoleucine patch superfamily enzyme
LAALSEMLSKVFFYAKSAICTVYFRLHGVQCSLVACEGFLPVLRSPGTIRIGKRFVVRGRIARCELATKDAQSQLLIGDMVFINQGTVIAAAESVEIGDGTLIGDFCAIYDSNFHDLQPGMPDKPRPVSLGKNVWLGNGVMVLPGSAIGDHTVVAARSVVRGTLPSRVLAAGNPAKVIRKLDDIPDDWRRETW